MCCLPWKMKIYAHPDSWRLGTVPGPWIMRAKDHCLKISVLSSQKISKDLCNGFLNCQQTIESIGKANQPLFSGWKPISAFRTLALVVEIGIYCSKFSFSLKDWVLMNPVQPTVLPCEGRRPKRNPMIQLKVDHPSPEGYKQIHGLGFVLPALFYQFFPSLILNIFKLHNKISDICLTKCSYSISSLA